MTDHDERRLLTRAEVERLVGLRRSSIYRLMRANRFPAPLKIGDRAVRWISTELDDWLAGRPRATGDGARALSRSVCSWFQIYRETNPLVG